MPSPEKTIESNIRHVFFEDLAVTCWPRIAVRTTHEIFLHVIHTEAVFHDARETHNMGAIPMVAMHPSQCRIWLLEAITANGTERVVIVNCEDANIHIRHWTRARRLATT